jgi:hypothetical protein
MHAIVGALIFSSSSSQATALQDTDSIHGRENSAVSAIETLHKALGTNKRTLSYYIKRWFKPNELYMLDYDPKPEGTYLTFTHPADGAPATYFVSTKDKWRGSAWIKSGIDSYDKADLYSIGKNTGEGLLILQNPDHPDFIGLAIVRSKNAKIVEPLGPETGTFMKLEEKYELLLIHEQNLNSMD